LTGKLARVYNRRMGLTKHNPDKLAEDLDLVAGIRNDDDNAWELFVDNFTDWVLYKAKQWCKSHCRHMAGEQYCTLTSLSLQRKGRPFPTDLNECDEGLDTYIWLFEQLQRRIKKYSGKNNCLLSTFVWTILNSKEFHIDWLRWKYGRIF